MAALYEKALQREWLAGSSLSVTDQSCCLRGPQQSLFHFTSLFPGFLYSSFSPVNEKSCCPTEEFR